MSQETAIRILEVGPLEVNCCILRKNGRAVVIDPGADAEDIETALEGATLEAILLTHAHYDHIGAVNELRAAHPDCRLLCHEECDRLARLPECNFSLMIGGIPCSVEGDIEHLEDGQEIELSGMKFRTYLVPGHMPGQLCFYYPEAGTLFSGDTVFSGSIGRSDFPGGNGPLLVKKILAMLRDLPPETILYPGHGPATRADRELSNNPYLHK